MTKEERTLMLTIFTVLVSMLRDEADEVDAEHNPDTSLAMLWEAIQPLKTDFFELARKNMS